MKSLMHELVVDNFAGGGGASTGIELAIGRSVDIAINHDPAAIAMHKVNHPETEHYCESVWEVDPREVTRGRPVALCWLSPDCKHFSKAKGGKPKDKGIRGLAWVAVRWAATVKPRVIMLENVEEFRTWGPLLKNGMPDPDKKGKTFNSFVNALKRQGYKVEFKELRACDYGAPTTRKRLFMIARCDGRPIVWPKPTHGDPESLEVKSGKLKPWRTAAEIIDWSLPVKSIFERKRPLAENTMRRIAIGIQKFVINNPEPFVIRVNYTGSNYHYCDSIHEPLKTITMKNGWGIVTPFLAKYHTETTHDARGQTLDKPLLTQDTSNRFALVSPRLVDATRKNHSEKVKELLMKYWVIDEYDPDRIGLVTIHGRDYQIIDIGLRMLEPYELFAAQGFPPEYVIDRDAEGKKYPKSEQVARCGNSVPPPFAEHLVRANLPELCVNVTYKEEHQLELKLV